MENYYIKMNKKVYIEAIKEFNFPGQKKEAIQFAFMKWAKKSFIIAFSIFIVLGAVYGVSFVMQHASPEVAIGSHKELLDIARLISFITLPVLLLVNSVQQFYYFKVGRVLRRKIKEYIDGKDLPKYLFAFEGDWITMCPVRVKGAKLVIEPIKVPIWQVRDILPYNKYGVHNVAIIATSKDLIPVVVPKQQNFDDIKDILN